MGGTGTAGGDKTPNMSSFSTRARLAARACRTGDAGAESDGASGPGSGEPTPARPQPTSGGPPTTATILDSYATGAPSAQAAVDIFKGEWSSALPADLGVEAGTVGLFEDARITWVLERLGSVEGASASRGSHGAGRAVGEETGSSCTSGRSRGRRARDGRRAGR